MVDKSNRERYLERIKAFRGAINRMEQLVGEGEPPENELIKKAVLEDKPLNTLIAYLHRRTADHSTDYGNYDQVANELDILKNNLKEELEKINRCLKGFERMKNSFSNQDSLMRQCLLWFKSKLLTH